MQISAVLLTVALAAQTAPQPSTEAAGRAYFLFLQGRALAEDDDVAGAIDRYRQAIALLGDSSDLRAEIAQLHARENRMTEARTEAERAVALDDGNRAAHRILGLIQASDFQSAQRPATDPGLASAIRH